MDWRGAFPSVRAERKAAAREQAARETAAAEVAALKAEVDELRADLTHALRLTAANTGLQPSLDAVIAKVIADGPGGET